MSTKLEKTEGPFESREEANKAIFRLLKEKTTLGAKPEKIFHYFYFKNQDDCKAAAEEFSDIGIKIEEMTKSASKENKEWLLLCSTIVSLNEERMNKLNNFLDVRAKKYHGNYDGWEIEVQPDSLKGLH